MYLWSSHTHTHTSDMRALDQTCCTFTPSSAPHRWSSLLCIVLTGCRSQQTGARAMRSTHNDWDVPSNIPRCTGLCRTSVSAFFFCTALGTKQDENMQQLKKEKKKKNCPPTDRLGKKKERGKVLQQRFTVPLYEHWGCCSINPLSLCFYWEIWSRQTDGGGAAFQIRLTPLRFCRWSRRAQGGYTEHTLARTPHWLCRCDDAGVWAMLTHVLTNIGLKPELPRRPASSHGSRLSSSGLWCDTQPEWDIFIGFIIITSIKIQHGAL